jgi:hypothetical protein
LIASREAAESYSPVCEHGPARSRETMKSVLAWSAHMPPRYLSWAIIIFWLATASWFFYRDLWPRIHPEDRPPFSIDLAEEARTPSIVAGWNIRHNGENIGRATTLWDVFFNGQSAGEAYTLVRPHDDDGEEYELYTNMRLRRMFFAVNNGEVHIRRMEEKYIVGADGVMRSVDATFFIEYVDGGNVVASGAAHFSAKIENNQLIPEVHLDTPVGKFAPKAEPIELTSHLKTLDSMRLWNRLNGLQENQTWRLASFGTFGEAMPTAAKNFMPGLGSAIKIRYVEAGVLGATDERRWDNRDVPCLVIQYRDQDEKELGKTYVRKSDGLVLRQEATYGDNTLTMERKPR